MQNYLAQPAEYALLIKQYILDGTDPLACLNGITVTGGRLNISNSLDYFEQEPEQYEVSGNITADVTWAADTVHVVGDVYIENNVTVTIPAGTRIQFEDYYCLDVQGTMIAQGTETDSIRFTVADTTGFINPYLPDGGWNGINFSFIDPVNEPSIFAYCIFEYGKAIDNYQPVEGGCFEIINTPQLEFNSCAFLNNYAGYGGAIYSEASQLDILNCRFNNNLAAFCGGSIFASDSAQINISNGNFNDNLALQGGALHITASDLTLNENEFSNNITRHGQDSAGGALYLQETSYTIAGNMFSTNQSSGSGGGVYIEGTGALPQRIFSNRFLGNSAADNGGSISITDNSQIEIINNLIVNSTAEVAGGLYLLHTDSVHVFNNTIADNNADFAGGMAIFNALDIELINNIFWDNQATCLGDQLDLSETDITIFYNDIEGGLENILIGDSVAYIYENNMDSDPAFASTGDHPYEITQSSSCINMGTPDTTGLALPEFDLAGNPRIYEGFVTNVDMGAYEFQGDPVNSEDELIPADNRPGILSIYPNPFNPVTTISFALNTEETEKAELEIYNIKGQKVKKYLISNLQYSITNDQYSVTWDGTDSEGRSVPSGVYFSKLTTDRQYSFRKMVLLK
jgi:predicted outer membrane repeat protein